MNPDLLPRVWQNGELVPWSDATVSVLAQSMQRASLVFDIAAFHPTAQGTAFPSIAPSQRSSVRPPDDGAEGRLPQAPG